MSRRFIRKKEDFTCLVCGKRVYGNGYTDHCPFCLWGRHVDIFPGDRRSNCTGLMKPIGVDRKKGEWRILYQCQKCNYQHWNRKADNDGFEKIIELVRIREGEESKAFSKIKKQSS